MLRILFGLILTLEAWAQSPIKTHRSELDRVVLKDYKVIVQPFCRWKSVMFMDDLKFEGEAKGFLKRFPNHYDPEQLVLKDVDSKLYWKGSFIGDRERWDFDFFMSPERELFLRQHYWSPATNLNTYHIFPLGTVGEDGQLNWLDRELIQLSYTEIIERKRTLGGQRYKMTWSGLNGQVNLNQLADREGEACELNNE